MSVEIANESGVAVDEFALASVSRFALAELGINPLAELSVLLVDVDAMTDLHVKWMDEPGPTDVMSFPMDELDTARRPDDTGRGPALLGDVVLCPAVATGRPTRRGTASTTNCTCSPSTASCTCSATTTPNRPRRRRCSGCRTSCWTAGGPTC